MTLISRVAILLATAAGLYAEDHSRRVCELLEDLPKVNGEIVVVRGTLTSVLGTTWLREEKCEKPFRVGDCKFDNLVAVDWPDSYFVQRELRNREVFPLDVQGRERIRAALSSSEPGAELLVAMEGMIVTRLPLTMLVHPRSPASPRGFGHLGAAPAMIVVKRVIALEALVKPK